MAIKRPKTALTMAVSAVVFAVAVVMLGIKIADFNKNELPARAYFSAVTADRFSYGEHPVSFTEEIDEAGSKVVVVNFGDQTLRLRETIKNDLGFVPDLRRYEDWLHVYRFVMVKGMSGKDAIDGILDDSLDDRLAIVVRTPPPGTNHRTWGEVWSGGWMFDLYELKESGEIVHERLGYPSKRKGNEPPKDGELVEGTWQFDAAMTSIPPVSRPKPQFNSDASLLFGLDFIIAGIAGVAFAFAAGFYFSPSKRTEESDAAEAAAGV
jgi:hypothetical protein